MVWSKRRRESRPTCRCTRAPHLRDRALGGLSENLRQGIRRDGLEQRRARRGENESGEKLAPPLSEDLVEEVSRHEGDDEPGQAVDEENPETQEEPAPARRDQVGGVPQDRAQGRGLLLLFLLAAAAAPLAPGKPRRHGSAEQARPCHLYSCPGKPRRPRRSPVARCVMSTPKQASAAWHFARRRGGASLTNIFFKKYNFVMNSSAEIHCITERAHAAEVLQPLRLEILQLAREPASASEISQRLGLSRQRVNYHVRILARSGFLRRAGRRRRRNMIEQRYVASARAFLLSPELLGGVGADWRRVEDAAGAGYLLALNCQMGSDLVRVWRESGKTGKRASTLSLKSQFRFESSEQRERFERALRRGRRPRRDGSHVSQPDGGRLARARQPVPARSRLLPLSAAGDRRGPGQGLAASLACHPERSEGSAHPTGADPSSLRSSEPALSAAKGQQPTHSSHTFLARIIHERLRPSRGSFSAMRRQPSSAMRPGIAVVGLPCLTKKSLAGTRCTRSRIASSLDGGFRHSQLHVFRPGVHELSGLAAPHGEGDQTGGAQAKRLSGERAEEFDPREAGVLEHRDDLPAGVDTVPRQADLALIAARHRVPVLDPAGLDVIAVFRRRTGCPPRPFRGDRETAAAGPRPP